MQIAKTIHHHVQQVLKKFYYSYCVVLQQVGYYKIIILFWITLVTPFQFCIVKDSSLNTPNNTKPYNCSRSSSLWFNVLFNRTGHSETHFKGSDDPSNSIKALR